MYMEHINLYLSTCAYQDTACTSRFEITDILVHSTEGCTGSDASPLHGAAQTGKPLRLHSIAWMYGCTAAVLQPTVHPSYSKIYLTATLKNLEVHGPLCASCTAARTCTACPTWTIARNCTEPMQRHCKLHVGARHCTAVS